MRILIITLLLFSISVQAREQLRIVGSSTLYPFITIAAERFGKKYGHTPVVEATGTGGGIHLICSGDALRYPDIVNASRKIKPSEIALCKKNGVSLQEIMLGYDGIIVAQSTKAKKVSLTREQLFLALAKKIPYQERMIDNHYHTWKDIDPKLPNSKIEVYGPSFTSGTRDAFIELVMNEFCDGIGCKEMRNDGHYIEMPENDNLIIHKLLHNTNALGIISFSLLEENAQIKAMRINDVAPSKNNIINGKYPLARPLFIYVNNDHNQALPDLPRFIKELTGANSIGENGYLTQKGLLTKH
jgi:phosphate transport system substrate-binding protein